MISIATAPMLRSDPLLAAMDQGCHVLVEKPISVGIPEARVMSAAARAANTVTACCFNWRYAPAYQTAQKAIRSGQIGAIRDLRTEGYFRARSQTLSPWAARMDITNGTLGEGLSHDFDKARYLSGEEFLTVIGITPAFIKQDDDFFVDGGRSMHLAELSGGILAQFCFSITVGEDRFSWLIVGDEGSLRIPDSGTVVIQQRRRRSAGRVGDRQCRQSGAVHRANTTHLESPHRGLHRGGTQRRQEPRGLPKPHPHRWPTHRRSY